MENGTEVRECGRRLEYAAGMTNQGKVNRVLREAVAVLVEELGRDEAAAVLEAAVAQLRGRAVQPKRATVERAETAVPLSQKRRRRVGQRLD